MIRTCTGALVSLLAIVLLRSPFVKAADTVCVLQDNGYSTVCKGDTWSGTNPVTILTETTSLTVEDLTLLTSSFLPIPSVTQLRFLYLSGIMAKDHENQVTRFPFKRFISLLSFPDDIVSPIISSIYLTNLDLQDIKAYDFEGPLFLNLASLRIVSCRLTTIDPKSFSEMSTDAPPRGAVLSRLGLTMSKGLSSFPWEVLRPFEKTLTSVSVIGNDDLLSVDYSPAAGKPALKFKQLYNLYFSLNRKLPAFSRSVVETFADSELPSHASKYELTFVKNGNSCGTCDLIPVIYWYRNLACMPRLLKASCTDSDGENFDYPETEQYWMDFPIPSECSTAPFPTRPPTTQASTRTTFPQTARPQTTSTETTTTQTAPMQTTPTQTTPEKATTRLTSPLSNEEGRSTQRANPEDNGATQNASTHMLLLAAVIALAIRV